MAVGPVNRSNSSAVSHRAQIQHSPVKQAETTKTQQSSQGSKNSFEQKVDNKFGAEAVSGKKFDHKAALHLARKVFAETVVGGVVDDKLKTVKSKEEALSFCHDLASSLANNPRLDPEAKKVALQEIGKKFGQFYSPDDPKKAKTAGDWLFKKTFPDSLKNAKTSIEVSGFTPKEFAHQQLQSMLWAVGAADSPL